MAVTKQPLDVQISMLMVDGEHMTPVMFRQIPRQKLVDHDTLLLNGAPFARVQYYWGGCKAGSHLHVLWITPAKTLARDCIYPTRGRGLPPDPAWTLVYQQMQALEQVYIDGDHRDIIATNP